MSIIITGASRGIGKAIADKFASEGHDLVLTSKNDKALYDTVQELTLKFPLIVIKAKPFDLANKEKAIAFGEWCLSIGKPAVLINNAGLFEPGNVFNEKDGLLEDQLAVNLLSAYHVTRTIIPAMMEQKNGHVFNMCSIASLHAYPNGGSYSISKFALLGFSRNLREEMKNYNVKVTAVIAGAVMTDSWGDFDNRSHRIMEASDIAHMIYAATQLSSGACVEEIILKPQLGDL